MNEIICLSAGILLFMSTMAQQTPDHNAVWSVPISSLTSSAHRGSLSSDDRETCQNRGFTYLLAASNSRNYSAA